MQSVFSSNQLAASVVPIYELIHAKIKATLNTISQRFLVTGTLVFEIAIVNAIKYYFRFRGIKMPDVSPQMNHHSIVNRTQRTSFQSDFS